MNPANLAVPLALVIVLVVVSLKRGGAAQVRSGFTEAGSLFLSVLPNLAIGFTLAGFIAVLLPRDLIAGWLGPESGVRGLLVGSAAGALTPGGPFTHFPILASLLDKGAGVGPVSAYIASWALIGVHRILIWEIPILGWRFALIRVAACLVFPPLIGAATQWLAALLPFANRA
ncbi:MAG: permease [Planctomycetes bacterium]|jgi:uncharacterized membrane protein YraQ (UPF0718 family)|nr:permease [Planctomycetota bacterium]